MFESMTGYGRGEARSKGRTVVVELKSVNSKFLEVRTKTPRDLSHYDAQVAAFVKKNFKRGSIDVFINSDDNSHSKRIMFIDDKKALLFTKEIKALKKKLKLSGDIGINTVLRNKDIFSSSDKNKIDVDFKTIQSALKTSVSKLKEMRMREGRHLEADIKKRLDRIEYLVDKIDSSKYLMIERMMDRLKKRISEFKKDIKFDPGRLEQEIVIYAAKADIAEEITRLQSHLKKFSQNMSIKGPCGRNLDFVVQEMNREVNTIGSKSQASEISSWVVDLKGEIEKIREQIQNVE